MLAFSSLKPLRDSVYCSMAWEACSREGGGWVGVLWGGGGMEKEFRKRKSPSKVTPSELLSMREFSQTCTLFTHQVGESSICIRMHTRSLYYSNCNLIVCV